MNCKEIKEKMWDCLLEDNLPQEMEEHFKHCPNCRTEFEQLQQFIQSLKPKIKISASDNFVNNTIEKLNMEDKKMKKKIPLWTKTIAAVMLILLFGFAVFFSANPTQKMSASPANQIFAKSLITLSQSKSMRVELKIRTLKRDNFDLIGTDYGFVKHSIKVKFSNPKKWRIEKSGRTVVCDGKNQYLNIQNREFILKADTNAGFVGWLSIFFTPDKILEIEKERSEKQKSNYTVKETKDQLVLTVYSQAQGDFTNDYLKNSSVMESDNKRIFYFDKKTHQLLSFKLYVIKDKKEILVMKTTDIQYDEMFDAKDFDVQNFGDKKIRNSEDLNTQVDEEIKNKTPEEIAHYFFESCAANEWENVEKVYPYLDAGTKDYLGGLQIIEIGQSFKSGRYSGFFVPYTIKLKSGHTKKHKLAIRNDNPEKMWRVDGGI